MDTGSANLLAYATKPKYFPDLAHNHWVKWYNTRTYLGPIADGSRSTFSVPSSQHLGSLNPICRRWSSVTVPSRAQANASAEHGLDLTTPGYKLASDDVANDVLVGVDYYNAPLEFVQDMLALKEIASPITPDYNMYMRTIAINHTFTFVNYSRFPMEIFYQLQPNAFEFHDYATTTTPALDLSRTGMKKIIVPGVMDSGDKGVTRNLTIATSLEKLFPDCYDTEPRTHFDDSVVSAQNDASAWVLVNPASLAGSSLYATLPPGQYVAGSGDSPTSSTRSIPGLQMRMYARIMSNFKMGATTEATGANGDIATNSLEIYANMNWKVEIVRRNGLIEGHPGPKAYPDQTA